MQTVVVSHGDGNALIDKIRLAPVPFSLALWPTVSIRAAPEKDDLRIESVDGFSSASLPFSHFLHFEGAIFSILGARGKHRGNARWDHRVLAHRTHARVRRDLYGDHSAEGTTGGDLVFLEACSLPKGPEDWADGLSDSSLLRNSSR